MLKQGDKAPDFELQETEGNWIKLSELKGRKVVLYFYPKDMTPGCTIEACEFTNLLKKFEKMEIHVFGVSTDDIKMHQNFSEKHNLDFPLLADTKAETSKMYGVYDKSKSIKRTTFLIDEQGNIEKVWEDVNPEGHAAEVLFYLRGE